MASAAGRFFPPRAAVRLGLVIVTVVVVVALPLGLLFGTGTGVAAALGGLSVMPAALKDGPVWRALLLGLTTAGFASLAAVVSGEPILLGLVLAASVLAGAPLVLSLGAVLGVAPVAVAAAGTDAAAVGPLALGLGVAAGALAMTYLLRAVLKVRIPPTPIPPRLAWTYMIALAAGSGAAIGIARALEVSHSLWIIVALSAVLVPAARETRAHAVARVNGTVVGAMLATAVATLLPVGALVAVASGAMVIGAGWAAAQSQSRASAWTAGALVLIFAMIEADAVWVTAVQRAGLTLIGAAVATTLALLIARVEAREEDGAGEERAPA